uniref:BTB domain-containing protein n=1 Tax=Panagrolaimus sp. ES5 TaxID=591445 RepID=A0AC34FKG0_9BILA
MEFVHKTNLQSPAAIKWTIPEARLKAMKDNKGLYSKRFNASNLPGVEYYIGIYTYGDDSEKRRGQTWIFFYLNFTGETKIKAHFNIRIQSANFLFKDIYLFQKSVGWGGKCCETVELFDPEKRFIIDGELTIQMEGILMTENEEPIKTLICNSSGDSLCLALWEQENKDFVITVGKKEIAAHKVVLVARSPVFARMFESGLKEAKENKVIIEDFSFDIVEAAVKLCYHHSLVPHTSLDDKMKLLQFFDKYEIQQLKNDLEAYMITVIDESNVCKLINCSLLTISLKLEKKCTEFLQDCLQKRKPIANFDLLDKEFANNFLKNTFCNVSE